MKLHFLIYYFCQKIREMEAIIPLINLHSYPNIL